MRYLYLLILMPALAFGADYGSARVAEVTSI